MSEQQSTQSTSSPRPDRALFRFGVHSCRAILFGLILLLLHWQHEKYAERTAQEPASGPAIRDVQEFLPQANRLVKSEESAGWTILDQAGSPLGFAVLTLPAADHIIGFSGPTNVLLVFDEKQHLAGVKILESRDTLEHVQAVVREENFFKPLLGKSWDQLAEAKARVDAISGATLTSLAIWESILTRLGGERQGSLRFPHQPTLEEAAVLFPKARSLSSRDGTYGLYEVLGENHRLLGQLLRTTPAADGLVGYQGPTDTLIGFDPEGRCLGLIVKDSFDNEPYVGYVRDDDYFASLFEGMTIEQLAELDLKAAGIEGVSGATMTSINVARGIKRAAGEFQKQKETPAASAKSTRFQLSPRDWGTSLVVLAGLVIGFTNLRGKKWVRIPFQLLLIGYLGFINGDLVSQALLVGWAEHGIPWRSATGLVLLTTAAVIVPIFSRQNVYCHQICPHGAAQQLLKHRVGWQLALPKWLTRILSAIPFVLLFLVVVVSMQSLPYSLVDLEPFDAYVPGVAGTATVVIFVVGLVASLFVPMAYCRFGCPTGALLGFLRYHGRSDRLNRRDALAVGLLVLALLLFATT